MIFWKLKKVAYLVLYGEISVKQSRPFAVMPYVLRFYFVAAFLKARQSVENSICCSGCCLRRSSGFVFVARAMQVVAGL